MKSDWKAEVLGTLFVGIIFLPLWVWVVRLWYAALKLAFNFTL